jgi:hypothetical protein
MRGCWPRGDSVEHTAAVYRVRVRGVGRGNTDSFFPFGDFDGHGTNLAATLLGYMNGMEVENETSDKVIRCLRATYVGDEIQAVLQHGESGIAADIIDAAGDQRIRQNVEDTQLVKCGALFNLPRTQTTGWLAIHVNHGRGVKGLFGNRLVANLREGFTDRLMLIEPCVNSSALREAISQNRLDKVKLVASVRPDDIANPSLREWVPGGTAGKLELDISGHHIVTTKIRRFLDGESELFGEIVTFEGMTFDQAKVEVEIDGSRRTYNIQKPESGHPMTVELQSLQFQNGDPTDASLFAALRTVLTDVTD